MTEDTIDPALADVRREALSRRYVEGLDFFVQGFRTTFSSELVLLVREEGEYRVVYRDMGQERTLVGAADVDAVRPQFFQALQRLNRGREPQTSTRPEPSRARSDEDVLAEFMTDFPDSLAVADAPDPRPDARTWSSDVLDGMTDDEQQREVEGLVTRAIEESRRRLGELQPGDISERKAQMPTITRVVSAPEERAARGRREDER